MIDSVRHMHKSVAWRGLVIGAVAVTESAADIYAPAQSALQKFFCCSCTLIALTMSINLLGMAIASLIFGGLSDYIGRKKALLGALVLFAVASLGAVFATSIGSLIFWRFLQGVGGGGAPVCAYSVISDLYKGKERAKELSLMGMFTALVPAIAPIFGSVLLYVLSWRAIFMMLFVFALICAVGVYLYLEESHVVQEKVPVKEMIVRLLKVYRETFASGIFCKLLLAIGIVMGMLWVEIAHLPFALMDSLGVSPALFSVMLSINVGTYILFARVNQKLVMRTPLWELVLLGFGCSLVSWLLIGGVFVCVAIWPQDSQIFAWALQMAKLPGSAGFAFLLPNLSALLFATRPKDFGAVSALMSFAHMILGSVLVYVMGYFYNQTFYPMFILQALCMMVLVGLFWKLGKKQVILSA